MNFTVTIPTEIVDRLRGVDISRRALEAFAIEEFRIGNLTQAELCRTLGFATRGALDVFLKARGIYSDLEMQDLHEERRDLDRLGF